MSYAPICTLARTVTATAAIAEYLQVTYAGALPSATGAVVMGSAHHAAAIDDDLTVDVMGELIGVSGAAIAVGAALVTNSAGKLITNPGAGGEYIVGYAVEAVSAADTKIRYIRGV